MAENVDYLIAYAWHPASNAMNSVEYAQSRGIVVTNLGSKKRELLQSFQNKL